MLSIIKSTSSHEPDIKFTIRNAILKKDILSALGIFYSGTKFEYITFYFKSHIAYKSKNYVDWEMFEFDFKAFCFEATLLHAKVNYVTKYQYKYFSPEF